MPSLPRLLRPAVVVRRKALYDGVFGPSVVWKAVAAVVFGRGVLRRLVSKQPEVIGTERLEPGQWIRIEALPAERRGRRSRRRAS